MSRLGLNEVYSPSGPLDLSPVAGQRLRANGVLQLRGDSATPDSGVLMRITTDAQNGTAAGADFYMNIHRSAQTYPSGSPDPREDNVLTIGYNVAAGGGRKDTANHALAFHIESYYRQQGGGSWTEAHLQFESNLGEVMRPISIEVDTNGSTLRTRLEGDILNFTEPGGNSIWFSVDQGGMRLEHAGMLLHRVLNNVQFLTQGRNGGGGSSLIFLDALNRAVLGDSETDVVVERKLVIGGAGVALAQLTVQHTRPTDDVYAVQLLKDNGGYALGRGMVTQLDNGSAPQWRYGFVCTTTGIPLVFERLQDGWERSLSMHLNGDVEVHKTGGQIWTSPDGSRWRISVSNAGVLAAVAA